MSIWNGEELDANDRKAAMGAFSPDAVDKEFLPYINRINALPFVTTTQSCVGHLRYDDQKVPANERPIDASENWGYLTLMLTLDVAQWLCQRAQQWRWLWGAGSQLFIDGSAPPGVTDNESYVITFAWDASHWPTPAVDLTEALEAYYAEGKGG
jgi:hypothetical protein